VNGNVGDEKMVLVESSTKIFNDGVIARQFRDVLGEVHGERWVSLRECLR